ncbi:alpha/beta hydrolase [Microbacterium sp.]|uniref:alpha/beta fold hydrolase n=1 Tax=Microbacterium sp. TaxID=51671 RepID=UPI002E308A81|nr:alpha/beta hydrolase [Microbacterium sp.]HEX5730934.1 alpha/beta hydrolase [Microbacterium sp.]
MSSRVIVPALVLVGDDDEPELEHTLAFYRSLLRGELAVVPNASHALMVEKPALVAPTIRDFHARPKTETLVPRRRAS